MAEQSTKVVPLRPAIAMGLKERALESPSFGSGQMDDAYSPRTGPTKVVSIAPEIESISPILQPLDNPAPKQYSAGIAKRLSGRPSVPTLTSRASLISQASMDELPTVGLKSQGEASRESHRHARLFQQVSEWLNNEKTKRARSMFKSPAVATTTARKDSSQLERTLTQDSENEVSFDKLQKILDDSMSVASREVIGSPPLGPRRPSYLGAPRRKSSSKGLTRTASSDTEYQDGDVLVPTCDVVLDNSKTMSYSGGGAAPSTDGTPVSSKKLEKERQAWAMFKTEILKLAHTLRLKGWRRVPLDSGGELEVERLSGALTNAVYVVSPPSQLPPTTNSTGAVITKKPPPKLLLRVYGPQVEHLIDRENELSILRRLARKKIGPRLLGTFRNGRFEEYLRSQTLTASDLRVPETSKHIAKRMRELHEGIDLLEQERDDGPFVWRNWDKWVDRCEHVVTYLDQQILSGKAGHPRSKAEEWKSRGLVCGVEWAVFRRTIERYRRFLDEHYGGQGEIRERLVFAHNDTQYGNILRLIPSGESPLMLPANTHKQLVVIDFEYASANTPGLEFANHFTEWCYNYHDAAMPYACNTNRYPTIEEQRRFVKSYVEHRPQFNPRASATPRVDASPGIGSVGAFMLDSRGPPGGGAGYMEEEERRVKQVEEEVKQLMMDVKIWRIANSAHWVAWGIVQAVVPGVDSIPTDGNTGSCSSATEEPPSATNTYHDVDKRPEGLIAETLRTNGDVAAAEKLEAEEVEDGSDEFDYLGYARDRAMFFWGDIVQLGLVKLEELPESVRQELKIVDH